MGMRLDALRREHNEITSAIDTIEATAQLAKRDLTQDENDQIDTLLQRAETIRPDIEAEGKKADGLAASAAVLAKVAPGLARRSAISPAATLAEVPTIGEYLNLLIRSKQGEQEATDLLMRANADQGTGDTTGLLPKAIVGPVLKLADSRRIVWSSFTSRPMPAGGKQFSRPKVTQRVNVGEQAAEHDPLATRKMVISGTDVTKRTFGGVLDLSEQDIDWTDPAALTIAIQDFADVYAETTEAAACAALVALATTDSPWLATNIGTIINSITTGIGLVYAGAKRMPDTFWLSLDEALTLAGTSNPTTGVSAMTLIRQALADAGIPLNFVTGPGLAADTRIIGCSSLVESYENVKGLITAPNVSELAVTMAYRGYAATYGVAAGFVSLEVA